MKVTYTQNRFEIDGVPVINPEILPVTAYVNSVLNLGSLVHNETKNVINEGDSFDLPENIIAEKVIGCDKCGASYQIQTISCQNAYCERRFKYRLKLKEPLVDTGSKESQDIIIEDLMNEFAPDWYKNYDDCPNIYEEIKSKFIITRK